MIRGSWQVWLGGKTIVGGLLGGTLAVEWCKARLGITERTGDLFVLPMIVAMMIGRVGCFFAGLADRTYGNPSNLPWAVDFGDGVGRHPTQLYEILFLALLAGGLLRLRKLSLPNGSLFRVFLFSYLAWRLAIDFLKPDPVFGWLSTIQWACLAGVLWYSRDILALFPGRRRSYAHG
jgi:prolipoprotein diacylglyceryltransferase